MLTEASSTSVPRPEYPRPQFARKDWLSLNGEWDFTFDDKDVGEEEQWYRTDTKGLFSRVIQVPFAFQSKLSGIEDPLKFLRVGMGSGLSSISAPLIIWQKSG